MKAVGSVCEGHSNARHQDHAWWLDKVKVYSMSVLNLFTQVITFLLIILANLRNTNRKTLTNLYHLLAQPLPSKYNRKHINLWSETIYEDNSWHDLLQTILIWKFTSPRLKKRMSHLSDMAPAADTHCVSGQMLSLCF